MSRSYHEIMERVEVTEEMRTRILGKIKSNDICRRLRYQREQEEIYVPYF